MATLVKHYARQGNRFVVVVGGGQTARSYITAAEALGANNGIKDYFGILVSRLNARLFIEALNDPELAHADPPESLQELRRSLQLKPIVTIGGLQPGQSTTAVSALCAEYVNAKRVVFCTDVDVRVRFSLWAHAVLCALYIVLIMMYGAGRVHGGPAQARGRAAAAVGGLPPAGGAHRQRELRARPVPAHGRRRAHHPGAVRPLVPLTLTPRLLTDTCATCPCRSRLNALIIRGTAENLRKALDGDAIGTSIEPDAAKQ